MADYADYAWLTSDAAAGYLADAADDARPALAQILRLRKDLPVEQARLIVEQVELRRRARAKFGDLADRMFFTPVHLEQATDLGIARYKASRLAAAATETSVADFCCGIGGDLIALAERGAATGWDLSPVACLLADANARAATPAASVRIECGDVAEATPGAAGAWHVDPDRRPSGQRSTAVDYLSPGPDLLDRWLAAAPHGAVKLAPATVAPDDWAIRGELEWIASDRECRQQMAWFGRLATTPGQRRATVIARGRAAPTDADIALATVVGTADRPCNSTTAPAAFIYDPDPAVLAARLLGELACQRELRTLGAGGAYLTGDHRVDDPLLTGFAVQDCLPLRPAIIADYLQARRVGRVEIKKRGVDAAPEALRKKLRLRGDAAATVILTRIGRKEVAIIARRLSPSEAGLKLN